MAERGRKKSGVAGRVAWDRLEPAPTFFYKREVDITITLYFRVRVLEGLG
jgi:hypothetical protein